MQDQSTKLRGIAHDINGLMARAMLAAEALRLHRDSSVVRHADRIGNAIDQVAEICHNEISVPNTTEPPNILTEQLTARLLREVADLVSIESVLSDQPIDFFVGVNGQAEVVANTTTLFRVLFNLALNAANAIAESSGSWIELSAHRKGDRVYFSIADDGPGLPDHVLRRLFPGLGGHCEPQSGRIGIGLSNAAALSAELGGELHLVETSEAGTRFALVLPVKDVMTECHAGKGQTKPVVPRASLRD